MNNQGDAPRTVRRWRVFFGGLGLAAAAVIAAIYLTAPRPPMVATDGVDFAIAELIERATARVRLLPWSGVAWGRLGSIFYVHHFNAAADEAFAVAERCSPRDPRWPYLRGLSMAEENLQAALPMLHRAAVLTRNGPPAVRLRLAELLLERGDLARAETEIDQVLRSHPNDGRALLNAGRLALLKGELGKSRDLLERARTMAPQVKTIFTLLASVSTRLGDKEGAARHRAAAASLGETAFWPDPFRQETLEFKVGHDALLEQGTAATRGQDFARARPILEKVTRDYPHSIRAWTALAHLHRRRGDLSSARRALESAFKVDGASLEAHVELGSILHEEKDFRAAEQHFREAIRARPEVAEAWFNLGLALLAQHSWAPAIDAFATAKGLKPDFADAYLFLGQALAMSGRWSEAAKELERSLAFSPGDVRAERLLRQVRKAMSEQRGTVAPQPDARGDHPIGDEAREF